MRGAWAAVVVVALAAVDPCAAQTFDVSGYALGVGTRASESPLGPAGGTFLGRFRLMPVVRSDVFTLDVAYEHVASRTPSGGGLSITTPGGEGVVSSDWLGADWEIRSTSRSRWRHRFDRIALSWEGASTTVVVGRQAISWATTLFLTPADPFSPFDPSDPFREYRGGVDAVRLQVFPGPFSEVDMVFRAASTPQGDRVTALARGQMSRGGWAVGAWGGIVHAEAALALFATGAAGATALRAEATVRDRGDDGGPVLRVASGADRNFVVDGRDLYVVAEVQYDGLGAASTADLVDAATSAWFSRGEMQTLGRWTGAVQGSYQLHPLVSADLLLLANLVDGSALVAPGVSWSVSSTAALRLGLFSGIGPGDLDPEDLLESEYGAIPVLGYASLTWFF